MYEQNPKICLFITYYLYFFERMITNIDNKQFNKESLKYISYMAIIGGLIGLGKYYIWIGIKNSIDRINKNLDIVHNFNSIKIIKSKILLILSFIIMDNILKFLNIGYLSIIENPIYRLIQYLIIIHLNPSDYVITLIL